MRLFCLYCMSLYCFSCKAGWIKTNTGYNVGFTSVYFTSSDTGYISGDSGLIIKTTNGGASWSKLKSGTNADLYCVYFINPLTGYVSGDSGIILKTDNGGETWKRQTSHISYPLFTITFSGENTGYAGGGSLGKGYILKTTDGGLNWDTINTAAFTLKSYEHIIYSIHFPSQKTGYATIRNAILKTTDGGTTWHEVNRALSLADSLSSILQTCYFISEDTGFTAGYYSPIMAGTTDGGATWKRTVTKNAFYKIHFTASGIGYAAGQSYKNNPVIYKTADRGKTWVLDYEDADSRDHKLSSIFSVGTNTYAAGNIKGVLYKKKDDSAGSGIRGNDMQEPELTLYPNPSTNCSTITISGFKDPADFSIPSVALFSVGGKTVKDLTCRFVSDGKSENKLIIDVTGVKNGAYFLKIYINNQVYSMKAIKI